MNHIQNALSYGWGEKDDTRDPFWVRFEAATRKPLAWKEELYATAREITKTSNGRSLWLCSSGGIDSEIMCHAFHDQGINFSVSLQREVVSVSSEVIE